MSSASPIFGVAVNPDELGIHHVFGGEGLFDHHLVAIQDFQHLAGRTGGRKLFHVGLFDEVARKRGQRFQVEFGGVFGNQGHDHDPDRIPVGFLELHRFLQDPDHHVEIMEFGMPQMRERRAVFPGNIDGVLSGDHAFGQFRGANLDVEFIGGPVKDVAIDFLAAASVNFAKNQVRIQNR